MKIAVVGMGYVGLTNAACLVKQGHDVVCIDLDKEKIAGLRRGNVSIVEPGLDVLIAEGVAAGRLAAFETAAGHIDGCDIVLICVGTPSSDEGSHDLSQLVAASRQIALAVDRSRSKPVTVAFRSTVRPGVIETYLAPVFASVLGGGAIELAYYPEFLREMHAIADFFDPPKVVIGTAEGKRSENMDRLIETFDAPVFYTPFRESEFIKLLDNTFHALKVVFVNEIGRICVEAGISASIIHKIFVSDTKLNISPYYMRPGGAFGGSCLPKDVRALQHLSKTLDADTGVIANLIASNEAHKNYLFRRATKGLKSGAKVLLTGLAFKSGSSDLRESPNLDLARQLARAGYALSIYDECYTPDAVAGGTLGGAVSEIEDLTPYLIDKDTALAGEYELVIDTSGRMADISFKAGARVRVDALP